MNATSERGQTLAEYAVVLGMITLAIVLAIASLSSVIVGMFQAAVDAIP
jgi:Flp pilus assembly pilin Flp